MSPDTYPIKKPVIAMVGPTAIGKTALSLGLAEHFNCEIISLDSMQVYRYMDIGTAKASLQERAMVPHHLIDIVDPDEPYDTNCFIKDSLKAINVIHKKNKIPLLTGGTGLYLKSLLEGLFEDVGEFADIRKKLKERLAEEGSSKLHDELCLYDCIAAKRIHKNDTHRLIRALEIYYGTGETWTSHINRQAQRKAACRFEKVMLIGLTCERDALYARINERTSSMLQKGLKEEVLSLISKGYSKDLKPMQSIGYRHMLSHLYSNWPLEETERILARDTRRYAKRQYTWFKKMSLEWFDVSHQKDIYKSIKSFLD